MNHRGGTDNGDQRCSPRWLRRMDCWGLGRNTAVLVAAVVVAWALAAPLAWWLDERIGLAASATAAVLCFFGAQLALLWSWWFSGPKYFLMSGLGGMLPRLAVPMAGALVLQILAGPLVEAGVLLYLLYFYPITLSLETAMSLPKVVPTG